MILNNVLQNVQKFEDLVGELRDSIGPCNSKYSLVEKIPEVNKRKDGVIYSDDKVSLLMIEYVNLLRRLDGKEEFDISISGIYAKKENMLSDYEKRVKEDGLNNGGSACYDFGEDIIKIYNMSNIKLMDETLKEELDGEVPVKSLEALVSHENAHREFNKKFGRVKEWDWKTNKYEEDKAFQYNLESIEQEIDEGIAYGMGTLATKGKIKPAVPKGLYAPEVDEDYVDEEAEKETSEYFLEKYGEKDWWKDGNFECWENMKDVVEEFKTKYDEIFNRIYNEINDRIIREDDDGKKRSSIISVAEKFIEVAKDEGEEVALVKFYDAYQTFKNYAMEGKIFDIFSHLNIEKNKEYNSFE